MAFLGWKGLSTYVYSMGDQAADMLITNQISERGYLLVGHYSRWGFNHPGPFWLYYSRIFELILNWTKLSREQIWQIASLCFSAICIVFFSITLSFLFLNKFSLTYATIISLFFISFVGHILSDFWMPYRLIAPYAAFLVCVFQISQSNIKYLIPAVLLTCILIHGYVTMPIFTLPFIVVSIFVSLITTHDHILKKENYSIFILCILIGAVFMLPILIDYYAESPNNIQKIIVANTMMKNMPKVDWRDISNVIIDIVFKENPIGWLVSTLTIPAIIILSKTSEEYNKKTIICLLHLILVVFVVSITYKNTPTPISTHVAQFIVSVPVLMFSIIFSAIFLHHTKESKIFDNVLMNDRLYGCALIIFTLALFSIPPKFSKLPDPGIDVFNFSDQIEVSFQSKAVSINYTDHMQWSFIAGLILELEKRKIHACTTWTHMAFLYTQRYVCEANRIPDIEVVPLDGCKNQCRFQSGVYGLKIGALHNP